MQSVERWAAALEEQLEKQNETYSRCTSFLRSKLVGQVKKVKCGKCDSSTWIGALVRFPCERRIGNEVYDVEHPLCFDCLEDKLERHRGFLDRERSKADQRQLYDRCLECVVTCDECHTPAVISRKMGFEGGIQTEDESSTGGSNRRRVRYAINEELTAKLRDRFGLHSFYENQRRSPFSKFSKEKLLRIERPHISDFDGNPCEGTEKELTGGLVWLEDWRVISNVAMDEISKKSTSGGGGGGGSGGAVSQSGLQGITSSQGMDGTVTESSFIRFSSQASVAPTAVLDEIAQTVTDPSGWQYAFIWPKEDSTFVKWMARPTANTFVRRRRKTRAYLMLTVELKEALQAFVYKERAELAERSK